MANEFYDHTTVPATGSSLSSATMRAEFDAVEAGMDKLPTMAANGNKVVKVNVGATGLTASASTITDDGTNVTLSGDLTVSGGDVSSTRFNGLTLTASTGIFTLTNGKTLTVSKTMQLTAADDTGVYTLPTGTRSLAPLDSPSFTTPNIGVATGTSLNLNSSAIVLASTGEITAGTGTFSGTVKNTPAAAENRAFYSTTAGTYSNYLDLRNTGGYLQSGIDNSAGSQLGYGAYYSGVSTSTAGYVVRIGSTNVGTFSSTGLSLGTLALTAGAGTFSGLVTTTVACTTAVGSMNINASDPTLRFKVTGGTANKSQYELRAIAAGGAADYFQLRLWNDANTVPSELAAFSSTGLSLGTNSLTAGAGTFSGTITAKGTAATAQLGFTTDGASTTAASYLIMQNTAGRLYAGVENSVGGASSHFFASGSSAYDAIIGWGAGTGLTIGQNGSYAAVARFTSTGLAVTGTLSATTGAAVGGATAGTGGIAFPATAVAVADANTLDDYEEGDWTTGIAFGGSSTGITYTVNTGTYTKIGRQVTVCGYMLLSSKGAQTGSATLTGLPFALPNANKYGCAAAVRMFNMTFTGQYAIDVNVNTTTASFSMDSEAGVAVAMTDANFTNTTGVKISLTYFI